MAEHRNEYGSLGVEPRISVVVAVLDGVETMQRCIDSVAEQTYPNKELIVMDGGSTDGTVEVLWSNAARTSYWESGPDRGIAHAWNKALDRLTGDWIVFLGADDYLAGPAVLEEMVPHLQSNSGEYLVFGRVLLRGGEWDGFLAGAPWDWTKFRRRMTVPHQAAFHSRRLFNEAGTFDESNRIALDYELLMRLKEKLKEKNSPVFVDKVVTVMSAEGLSMNYKEKVFAESRNAQIKYKVAPVFLINLWYVYFRGRMLKDRLQKSLKRRVGK